MTTAQDSKPHDTGDISVHALVGKTKTLKIENLPAANGDKKPAGYFDLPQELRDQICDELESGYDEEATLVRTRVGNSIALWVKNPPILANLLVSRQFSEDYAASVRWRACSHLIALDNNEYIRENVDIPGEISLDLIGTAQFRLLADCSQGVCIIAPHRCGVVNTFEALHVPWISNLAPRLPNVRSVEIIMLVSIRKADRIDDFRWPKNPFFHDFKEACIRMEKWAMSTKLPVTSMKVYHVGISGWIGHPDDLNFHDDFDRARQYGVWTKEKGWNSDEDRNFMNRVTSS